MTDKEKAILLGVIDEILVDQFGHYDHLTDAERDRVAGYYTETTGRLTPHDLRENLIALARKLYTEVFVDER